ncbi:hypothetical protein [Flagellimonas oceanensis]|uniref:hypothetical protein n=1 Tax=Flagellimonas oceanensis TaxID=2499163 RepID=UPI000F8F010D|nr:hypothetical protein [Allomuricauda oceanensis]
MMIHIDNWESVSRKLILSLHILFHTPKILYRYILFFLKKRELKLHSFTCTANYCIDGTLNQLQWDVENALFLILDNSSRIYFRSGDNIFKVSKEKSWFELKCYGLDKTINAHVHLKIVTLKASDFGGVSPKNQEVELRNSSFPIVVKKVKLGTNALQPKPICLQPRIPHLKTSTIFDGVILDRLSKIQRTKTLQELGEVTSETTN